jgi:hypothetical protein
MYTEVLQVSAHSSFGNPLASSIERAISTIVQYFALLHHSVHDDMDGESVPNAALFQHFLYSFIVEFLDTACQQNFCNVSSSL